MIITEENLANLKANGASIRRSGPKRVETTPPPTVVKKEEAPPSMFDAIELLAITQTKTAKHMELLSGSIKDLAFAALPEERKPARPFKTTMSHDKNGFLSVMKVETFSGPDGKPKVFNITMGRDKKGLLTSISGFKDYKISMNRDKEGFLKTIEAKPIGKSK